MGRALALLSTLALLAPAWAAADDGWAAIEADHGISTQPVLACRSFDELRGVAGTGEVNRPALAQLAAKRGVCIRLDTGAIFTIVGRRPGALHIRTAKRGRLWVAETARVPGIAELALEGPGKKNGADKKKGPGRQNAAAKKKGAAAKPAP